MTFLSTAPEGVASAADQISGIGSWLGAANKTAAASTTGLAAAARDEVSAAVAALFSSHGLQYQALSAEATAFHAQFVQTLNQASSTYVAAEAAGAAQLQTAGQDALAVINAPTTAAFGQPLIGNGANGTTNAQGIGTAGGPGGILWGNGGHGGDSFKMGAVGGAGGAAGLLGNGGAGGMGGLDGRGGTGGTGGLIFGNGGSGGIGGPFGIGGTGGNAMFFGSGGTGGLGGELGGTGGHGGVGGSVIGNGGNGGQGGVSGGAGSSIAGGHGGAGGASSFLGSPGAAGAKGGAPDISVETDTSLPRPYVDISVGGGQFTKVVLDTGSIGLILPKTDVNLADATYIGPGNPVTYGDANNFVTYTVALYNAPINFGNGIVTTSPTQIGVITSVTNTVNGQTTSAPLSTAQSILGVAASNNYLGPFTNSPVQSLPGPLNGGLLIDQPKNYVQFGANPFTPVASVSGASATTSLGVSIDGTKYTGGIQVVDSGGLWGDIPSSYNPPEDFVNGVVAKGTSIDFYVGNTFVFGETIGGPSQSPVVGPATDWLNTGDFLFEYTPTWIGYTGGQGTMAFD